MAEITVHHGDSREVLKSIPDCSIDSCVCDPPYALVSISKRFGADGAAAAKSGKTGAYARASAGFMGQKWDTGETAFHPLFWVEVLRVLKPGGHLIAFSGTRTYHRLACAIEDAGFEMRDMIAWLYGSGFSKVGMLKRRAPEAWCKCSDGEAESEHDVQSVRGSNLPEAEHEDAQRGQVLFAGLPKSGAPELWAEGAESQTGAGEQSGVEGGALYRAGQGLRDGAGPFPSESAEEWLRLRAHPGRGGDAGQTAGGGRGSSSPQPGSRRQSAGEPEGLCQPSGTLDGGALRGCGECPRCGGISRAFDGWGGSLKPALEPIVLARKPLDSTVAANVLRHGVGVLNIDGCRVAAMAPDRSEYGISGDEGPASGIVAFGARDRVAYRRPALGRWPANIVHDGSDEVVESFPTSAAKGGAPRKKVGTQGVCYGAGLDSGGPRVVRNDGGSAARFFYSAKADAVDRLGSKHPTVKPVDLMAWLCRLVTPPGGKVLDPFAGSGSTGIACLGEGFDCILIEREEKYVADIHRRVAWARGAGRLTAQEISRAEEKQVSDLPLFAGDAA